MLLETAPAIVSNNTVVIDELYVPVRSEFKSRQTVPRYGNELDTSVSKCVLRKKNEARSGFADFLHFSIRLEIAEGSSWSSRVWVSRAVRH
jgi:hypothetical protein